MSERFVRRFFTPEEDARIVAGYSTTPMYRLAQEIGVSEPTARRRIRELVAEGRLKETDRYYNRTWTKEAEWKLGTLIDQHLPYATIARRLKLSELAIRRRASQLGYALTRSGYTVRRVGKIMGVDSKTAAWWCNEGWLKSFTIRGGWGRERYRVVEHEDLVAFLESEEHWHVWCPERITDLAMCKWATCLRGHVRFLTVGQVAGRLWVVPEYVNALIREGRIKARKWGPNWHIRESDAIMPEWRQRPKGPDLTAEEKAYIRQHYGQKPAEAIARELGRAGSTVLVEAGRQGLPTVGRGHWTGKWRKEVES